jgi:hypothetical protein
MSRWRKIGVGALAGALLTLLLHPVSSRYMLTAFHRLGPCPELRQTPWLPRNLDVLPTPEDTLVAGLWMQSGAEILVRGKRIDGPDLWRLVAVAEAAAKGDPDNAFWPQMETVFRWEAKDRQGALQAWLRGSRLGQWNDYQSRRLERVRRTLSESDGGPMSWHSAAAYYQRSLASARAIERVARLLFERLALQGEAYRELRLATVSNGRLLREGSRSVAVGTVGANMIEFAASPDRSPAASSPRERILARFALISEVRQIGMREADLVAVAFNTNDAWAALAHPNLARENARRQASWAILLAAAPGVLLGVSLIGLLLRLGALALERSPRLRALLQPPAAPILGVLLGAAIYWHTQVALLAIAVAMCFGFLAYGPVRTRKRPVERLGMGFALVISGLAAAFALSVGAFWIGLSSPAHEIVPELNLTLDVFGGNSIFLILSLLVLSLILVAAPAWAIAERVPTPQATVLAFRDFSRHLAWGGAVLAVLAAPTAVYFDGQVRALMEQLLTNEPTHYLMQ